jgi:hypothetical protein
MELLRLAAYVLALMFCGFNLLYLIAGRYGKLYPAEAAAVSFGLGLGAVTLEMLVFSLAGFDFVLWRLALPWVIIAAINVALFAAGKRPLSAKRTLSPDAATGPLGIFLASGICLEVIYAFFRALIKPIEAYDAVAIYAIKSKIFFIANSVPRDYFAKLASLFPHPDYPLNIPLAETMGYIFMGSLNDQLVKAIFPLFFAGILILLYSAIRRFASRTYALLFTFMLASVPQFNAYAANAYMEVPLAYYYFASLVFLLMWFEDRSKVSLLVMSAIMSALAGWTKNEGLLYCAINTFMVCFFLACERKGPPGRSVLYPALYLAVIAAALFPWVSAKSAWGIANDEINLVNLNPANLMKQLHKLYPIFYEFQKQLFGPKKWNILWPVFLLALFFGRRRLFRGASGYLALSVALALCGYVVFYMISYVDVVFFASKTWARFMLHFLPAAVLLIATLLKEDIKL